MNNPLFTDDEIRKSYAHVKKITMSEANRRHAEREKEIADSNWMLGLKSGLAVANKVCKREGFEIVFPDPEKIMLNRLTQSEVKE